MSKKTKKRDIFSSGIRVVLVALPKLFVILEELILRTSNQTSSRFKEKIFVGLLVKEKV